MLGIGSVIDLRWGDSHLIRANAGDWLAMVVKRDGYCRQN